jgi:hypothetical protein
VSRPQAVRVFQLGVHGGGYKYSEEHASTYNRPEQNYPDEHRSIEHGPIVAAIVGESAAGGAFCIFGK